MKKTIAELTLQASMDIERYNRELSGLHARIAALEKELAMNKSNSDYYRKLYGEKSDEIAAVNVFLDNLPDMPTGKDGQCEVLPLMARLAIWLAQRMR